MSIPTAPTAGGVAAGVTGVLGAGFLDNYYGFTSDIKTLLGSKAYRKRIEARIKELGDDTTIYHMLELAKPDATAIWFEGRSWTYAEAIIEADRIAAILQQRGIGEGDFVAVYMVNCPEMAFAMYAIAKLGAVPALINSSLRSQTLAHCMRVANAKFIISSPDLAPALVELFSENGEVMPCISLNLSSFPPLSLSPDHPIESKIEQIRYEDLAAVTVPPTRKPPKRTIKDVGALVYTSGTSGKPKAVSCKNFLLVLTSTPVPWDVANPKRHFPLRTYSCMPMFHGTCLFTGVYYSVGCSSTFCIGRKFSARNFSKDLYFSGATRMLYVGELCRYLLAAPPSKYDRSHKCITATGNGMQKDVWNKFRDRFGITEIREFYRSTEGIAKYDNVSSRPQDAGYVGHHGLIRRYMEDETYLVKYNPATEAPWRDPKTGFCVRAAMGEPGEAIGRVKSMDVYNDYLNNPEANNSKLIKDVFEKGDLFQRTGDLLVMDRRGWVRFYDRTGDTFRWRGENVACGEVREHISALPNVHDVSVYGVKLSGYDGQAGAASITLLDSNPENEAAFCQELYQRLRTRGLTNYQTPRLIRFTKMIDAGATMKHDKKVLKDRPWHPEKQAQGDSLWWLDGEKYNKLYIDSWVGIESGKARL